MLLNLDYILIFVWETLVQWQETCSKWNLCHQSVCTFNWRKHNKDSIELK